MAQLPDDCKKKVADKTLDDGRVRDCMSSIDREISGLLEDSIISQGDKQKIGLLTTTNNEAARMIHSVSWDTTMGTVETKNKITKWIKKWLIYCVIYKFNDCIIQSH